MKWKQVQRGEWRLVLPHRVYHGLVRQGLVPVVFILVGGFAAWRGWTWPALEPIATPLATVLAVSFSIAFLTTQVCEPDDGEEPEP